MFPSCFMMMSAGFSAQDVLVSFAPLGSCCLDMDVADLGNKCQNPSPYEHPTYYHAEYTSYYLLDNLNSMCHFCQIPTLAGDEITMSHIAGLCGDHQTGRSSVGPSQRWETAVTAKPPKEWQLVAVYFWGYADDTGIPYNPVSWQV